MNIRKKWLIASRYHQLSANEDYNFWNLRIALDSLHSNYETFLLLGGFNSEDHEVEISSFINSQNLKIQFKKKHVSKVF